MAIIRQEDSKHTVELTGQDKENYIKARFNYSQEILKPIRWNEDKRNTIAQYLECEDELVDFGYDEYTFVFGNQEYLVVTDVEAYELAENYIKDSVWAFNSSFLASHSNVNEDIFRLLQDKCEDSNQAILNSINDIDDFIADAIACDGIAHFLSTYDGNEEELNDFYIYRTN